jgi:hypothetical protein
MDAYDEVQNTCWVVAVRASMAILIFFRRYDWLMKLFQLHTNVCHAIQTAFTSTLLSHASSTYSYSALDTVVKAGMSPTTL